MHRMLEKHCLETCSPMSKLEIRSEAATWLSCLACLDTESDLACMFVASAPASAYRALEMCFSNKCPRLHAFVFLRSAKTSLSKLTWRRQKELFTHPSASLFPIQDPVSVSTSAHCGFPWWILAWMKNIRTQEGSEATIERDVSPQISITPRDKQNKTRTAA